MHQFSQLFMEKWTLQQTEKQLANQTRKFKWLCLEAVNNSIIGGRSKQQITLPVRVLWSKWRLFDSIVIQFVLRLNSKLNLKKNTRRLLMYTLKTTSRPSLRHIVKGQTKDVVQHEKTLSYRFQNECLGIGVWRIVVRLERNWKIYTLNWSEWVFLFGSPNLTYLQAAKNVYEDATIKCWLWIHSGDDSTNLLKG